MKSQLSLPHARRLREAFAQYEDARNAAEITQQAAVEEETVAMLSLSQLTPNKDRAALHKEFARNYIRQARKARAAAAERARKKFGRIITKLTKED